MSMSLLITKVSFIKLLKFKKTKTKKIYIYLKKSKITKCYTKKIKIKMEFSFFFLTGLMGDTIMFFVSLSCHVDTINKLKVINN
jgi:hypothetical protein